VKNIKFTRLSFFRKGIFAKKSTRIVLDIIWSFVGLILVLLLLVLGRLAMGPINLDFLTPDVETALQAPQAGIRTTIDHTQLAWRKWYRPFEIELVNVHIQKDQNPEWLKIEHIGVSLRLYKLLGGTISLKQLRLYHPEILLEKNEQGRFTLGFSEENSIQEFSLEELAPLLALGESKPSLGKLNELNKIAIVEAHVLLKDDKANQSWELPKTSFVLRRQVDGFRAEVTFYPQEGPGSLMLGVAHRIGSSRMDVYADFHRLSFSKLIEKASFALSSLNPDSMTADDFFNFLQSWDVPFDGKINMALIPKTFQIIEGSCNLDFGKGELDLSLTKLAPIPITSGILSAEFSPKEIKLKKISLLSHEMLLDLSGKIDSPHALSLKNLLSPSETLELQGKLEDLLLDHLDALWPQNLAQHARKWLTENMKKGILTEATFSLKGHGEEEGFLVDDLKGTIIGEEAEITYLDGLPPAQNVSAHATFDKKGFDIQVLSGEVENIELQDGHILISNLDTDHESLTLNVKAKGPLSDILDVINHKPLEYASYGGIDPKKVKGEGTADLSISFPLLVDLQFKNLTIGCKGNFKKVALERKITDTLKAQLTEGNFSFNLTQDHMEIKGKGKVNQFPSAITYNHFFRSSDSKELEIKMTTNASFEDFKRFGFDYEEYVKGPTKTNLTYTLDRKRKGHFLIDLDTTLATFSFPPLDWEKKSGEKGELSFTFVFENGQLSKLTNLKMISPTYSLQGEVFFDPKKTWKTIQLSKFKGPYTDTQVTLHRLGENAYEISFNGHSVNVEKYLEYINNEETTNDTPSTDVKVQANVDHLRLGEGKVFQNVKASADLFTQGKETTWRAVSLRAKAGQGTAYKGDMAHVPGGISFDIIPGSNNTQILEVRANDAGQFLKNLSIYDHIEGGYITVKAQRKGEGPYKGVFKIKDFNAQKIPLLGRFAALLSPMGIVNLFSSNETLSMDRFECDFELSEDLVTVKNGVGKSISLGFTTEGKLNRKDRLFGLKGNIIPARFLNSILNNIPLIGPLITGGKDEGLFGIAYTVKGKFEEPDVSLNPLSALAPGFFRKLFQSLGDDE